MIVLFGGEGAAFIGSIDAILGPEMILRATGELELGSGVPAVFRLTPTGDLQINGTLTEGSDRTRKENLRPVDPAEVLQSVVSLPICRWNFIENEADTPHIGPKTGEFRDALSVGRDELSIAPLDAAGAALAAIQGLHELNLERESEIGALKESNGTLQNTLTDLKQRLDALE